MWQGPTLYVNKTSLHWSLYKHRFYLLIYFLYGRNPLLMEHFCTKAYWSWPLIDLGTAYASLCEVRGGPIHQDRAGNGSKVIDEWTNKERLIACLLVERLHNKLRIGLKPDFQRDATHVTRGPCVLFWGKWRTWRQKSTHLGKNATMAMVVRSWRERRNSQNARTDEAAGVCSALRRMETVLQSRWISDSKRAVFGVVPKHNQSRLAGRVRVCRPTCWDADDGSLGWLRKLNGCE